jgi:predicted acylesterase/phospholipase RssA
MIRGLLWKTGIVNTEPFANYALKYFHENGGKIQRRVAVASADANTGNFHVWNETEPLFSKAAVSSSSIQFIFPPQKWDDGTIAMDGGVIWGINIATAINRCKEIVDDDSQIIVDILMCSARGEMEKWENTGSTRGNYLRFGEIQKYNDGKNDVLAAKQSFPKVQFRYYVEPTATIPGGLDLINPDNSTVTWPM